MDLIIGGAYQGKLEYAKKRFSLADGDVFDCTADGGVDFSRRCVCGLEKYALYCVRNGIDAVAELEARRSEWRSGVLICEDIFCGVVPMGADMRAWREAAGRLCAYLSREADTVTRIFCGLEQRLK